VTAAPLRAGVIGLGWAGRQHMAAYADLDGVELVALAGMEPQLLHTLGDTYAVEQRFADWQQLLAEAELDVISVATPTVLHAPITVAALNAGLHVLSEKPIAESADVAQTMVQAARDNDRVLEVSFNHRRRGDVQACKQMIDSGALGEIYYAKAGWLRRAGIPGLGSWFTRSATAGGGPLMDIGVHMLDMALHLLGEPAVRTASASTYAKFGPRGLGGAPAGATAKTGVTDGTFDVEDLASAFLRLDGGGTLLLESSWAQWIPHDLCYVSLYGTEGGASLEWGGDAADSYHTVRGWTQVNGVAAELQPAIPADGGHRQCVVDFLAEVASGEFGRFRGEEALNRALVVDACYASAAQSREVTLEKRYTALPFPVADTHM
jgi:predicted dehydrogenase